MNVEIRKFEFVAKTLFLLSFAWKKVLTYWMQTLIFSVWAFNTTAKSLVSISMSGLLVMWFICVKPVSSTQDTPSFTAWTVRTFVFFTPLDGWFFSIDCRGILSAFPFPTLVAVKRWKKSLLNTHSFIDEHVCFFPICSFTFR